MPPPRVKHRKRKDFALAWKWLKERASRSQDHEPWEVQMKALLLALSLMMIYEAQAKEMKENREIAGQMMKKKKKKDSMWARNLRSKLSGSPATIRTF